MLVAATKYLAVSLGLEAHENMGARYGLIQSVVIRYGWGTKDFDDNRVKNEIADRTVFALVYAWEEKLVYTVTRSQAGGYEFSMEPKH